MKIEVSNVLSSRIKGIHLTDAFFNTLLSIQIDYIPTDNELIKHARHLAIGVNSSVYDALYHSAVIKNNSFMAVLFGE